MSKTWEIEIFKILNPFQRHKNISNVKRYLDIIDVKTAFVNGFLNKIVAEPTVFNINTTDCGKNSPQHIIECFFLGNVFGFFLYLYSITYFSNLSPQKNRATIFLNGGFYMLKWFFIIAFGYLLGSVSFAVLISKAFAKEDVRSKGSGNAGSTNMLRNYGKVAGVLTLAGDMLKGFVAGLVGSYAFAGSEYAQIACGVCGFSALIGHLFPIYFRFKGGKGFATSLGVIGAFFPTLFFPIVFFVLFIIFSTGYVSLSAISYAALFPVGVSIFGDSLEVFVLSLLISGVILVSHRENIVRLLKGTERNIKKKK